MLLGVIPELLNKYKDRKDKEKRKAFERGRQFAMANQGGGAGMSAPLKKGGAVSKKSKAKSKPRGVGCATRGYGKAMMGGGRVKGKY